MIGRIDRRSFLISFLCAPFVAAWRKIAPAKPDINYLEIEEALGGKELDLRATMSVDDYQHLYVDVLDRMYYGMHAERDFAQRWGSPGTPVDHTRRVQKHRRLMSGGRV